MTAACTFILQRRLYTWLCQQNCKHGVAPSRLQMVRRALALVPLECPLEVQASVATSLRSSARQQRKWLRRFRQVWGARLGVLKNISSLSPQDMQEKAGQVSKSYHYLFGPLTKAMGTVTPLLVVVFRLLKW